MRSSPREPADGVVQQSQQVAVAGEPVGPLDVSGKVGSAAGAGFAQHNCRLIGVRYRRIGQFRRIAHEAGNDGEHGILHRLERDAILRAGQPVGVGEAFKNRVRVGRIRVFDARIVRIAVGADDVAGFADAEQIGKSEICALGSGFRRRGRSRNWP